LFILGDATVLPPPTFRLATVAFAMLATVVACGGTGSGSNTTTRASAASTPNNDQGRLLYCAAAGIVHSTLAARSNGAATTQESASGLADAADRFNSAAFLTTGPNQDIYRSLAADAGRLRVDLLSADPAAFASDSSALTADIKRVPDASNC
jgi:hypothetical protein